MSGGDGAVPTSSGASIGASFTPLPDPSCGPNPCGPNPCGPRGSMRLLVLLLLALLFALLPLFACSSPTDPPCEQHITVTDHFIAGVVMNPIGPDFKSKKQAMEDTFGFRCTKIADGAVWLPVRGTWLLADFITYDCGRPC